MKTIYALIVAALVAGCATSAPMVPPGQQELLSYVQANRAKAEAGQLPWSVYYKGVYQRLSAANAPGDMLGRANQLILDAERYEAGNMTKAEFEYRQRQANSEQRTSVQAAQQAAAEQQRRDSAAQMAVAAQLLQAGAPHSYAPAPAPIHPVAATPSGSIMGFLQSQSTSGQLRYCRYSNGVVTTLNIMDLCPLNTQ
jgi:hypothetical protein